MRLTRPISSACWLLWWAASAVVLATVLTWAGRPGVRWLGEVLPSLTPWRLVSARLDTCVLPIAIVLGAYGGLVVASMRAARRQSSGAGRRPPLALIYGLLLLPVAFVGVFSYVPAASAVQHASTRWDVGEQADWVGLANFRELVTDPVFRTSCWNMLRLGVVVFIGHLTIPFLVAEMIFHLRSERLRYWSRMAIVLPMVVPGVVVFLLWGYIYSDAGVLTELLMALGLGDWVFGWLSHPRTALWAVACIGFPFAVGVNVLIYYAGLVAVPADVLEAGELDGLGPLGRVFRIHIPLLLAPFRLLLILTVITIVNGFEPVLILTQDGGPGYSTMVPGLYMYLNGFTYQRMGYACAIGLVMLVFLLSFTLAVHRLLRTED